MSRDISGKELGVDLFLENGDDPAARVFVGSTLPGGDSSFQDEAPVPSMYFRAGTKEVYKKIANTNNSIDDWELVTSSNLLAGFRNDIVRAGTGDAAPGSFPAVIDLVANPFGDDEAPILTPADLAVGERVVFGIGGTPVITIVTDITGDDVTFDTAGVNALADNDSFIVRNYLPDSPDTQEKQALLLYNGTDIVKIGDFNWNFADGISLNGTFTPTAGAIVGTDSVQVALEKLQFQINNFSGAAEGTQTAITAATTVDTTLVDDVLSVEYEVVAKLDSDPTRTRIFKIEGFHNGHAGADATTVKDKIIQRSKIGGSFNVQAAIVISGAGAAQTIGLEVESSSPGISISWRRTEVKAQGL